MNCPLSSRQVKKQSILDHACKNVWSFFVAFMQSFVESSLP